MLENILALSVFRNEQDILRCFTIRLHNLLVPHRILSVGIKILNACNDLYSEKKIMIDTPFFNVCWILSVSVIFVANKFVELSLDEHERDHNGKSSWDRLLLL